MTWECRIGRPVLENKVSRIALSHPDAEQDVQDALSMMLALFDSLHNIYLAAVEKQQAIEAEIEVQTIAVIGKRNYANLMQRMTPEQFKAQLRQHFEAVGVNPPSWGEVAEIACREYLHETNDPGGLIREEIKRALAHRL